VDLLEVPQVRAPVPRQAPVAPHRLDLELLVRTEEVDTTAEELQHLTLLVGGHRKDLLL
jgi:hypothetical protein